MIKNLVEKVDGFLDTIGTTLLAVVVLGNAALYYKGFSESDGELLSRKDIFIEDYNSDGFPEILRRDVVRYKDGSDVEQRTVFFSEVNSDGGVDYHKALGFGKRYIDLENRILREN